VANRVKDNELCPIYQSSRQDLEEGDIVTIRGEVEWAENNGTPRAKFFQLRVPDFVPKATARRFGLNFRLPLP
jgi:hypothetical protein